MDTIPNRTHALFSELGEQTDPIDLISFDEENKTWTVGFDDDSALLVEWDGVPERFMIQALLGIAPEQSTLGVYRAVLAYNALWREHGGSRIGLADADGELMLMVEVPAEDLSLEQLQRVLLNVRAVAGIWSRYVADPRDDDPDQPTLPQALSNLA